MTTSASRVGSRPLTSTVRVLHARSTPYWLSSLLTAVSALAAALTWSAPGVLTGHPVLSGSARGTALVVLVLAVPALFLAMGPTSRGSRPALVIWTGTLAYLAYNAGLFLYGTPFNRLFLLYVAMLALAVAALLTVVVQALPQAIHADRPLARPIAVYIWVVVGLNALVWLWTVVPALLSPRPADVLNGSGLATNPVYVQDLALHLPAMAVFGYWLWHRRPRGALLAGAGLVFWVIQSVTVSIGQELGFLADPRSPLSSSTAVPVFAVVALVNLVPAVLLLRNLHQAPQTQPVTAG